MILRVALGVVLAFAATPLLAAPYTFDTTHTQVVFSWNHFGFSHPAAQFGEVGGTLEFDAAHPTRASVKATVVLASVNSNVAALDKHLQRNDFFDSAKYPTATFKSTKVEQGAAPNRLKVTGNLTLRGVTKPIVLDVTLNKVGPYPGRGIAAVGFDATTTLTRSQFGITTYLPEIPDKVEVHITSEAVDANAPVKSGKPVKRE